MIFILVMVRGVYEWFLLGTIFIRWRRLHHVKSRSWRRKRLSIILLLPEAPSETPAPASPHTSIPSPTSPAPWEAPFLLLTLSASLHTRLAHRRQTVLKVRVLENKFTLKLSFPMIFEMLTPILSRKSQSKTFEKIFCNRQSLKRKYIYYFFQADRSNWCTSGYLSSLGGTWYQVLGPMFMLVLRFSSESSSYTW